MGMGGGFFWSAWLGLDGGLMGLGSDFCCRDLEDMICGGYYDSI